MGQRACVFAVPAADETEGSGCKQQWYHGSQGPRGSCCQELEQGRTSCQQLGWGHGLEDLCDSVPVNGETQLSQTKCQPLGWDQVLEGCGSVVPENRLSVGMQGIV